MNIKECMKKILPSYKTEKHIMERLDKIERDIKESNKKNEYLFWINQRLPGESMQDTKERVFLSMPKATGRLRNIQLAEKYILERVKDICDANEMELFLVGGTLMGAVRHKGFIPWDNDVDIGMMKADYLMLRTLLDKDDELVVDYCYSYEKGLKMSKVKFRAVDVFWIDILVFDYIDVAPDNLDKVWKATQEANKDHMKKIQALSAPYQGRYYCRPVKNHDLDSAIAEFEAEQLQKFPCFGKGDYFCEPIMCPWWSRDERGIRLVSEYFPLMKNEVEFEGRKYDVWQNYSKALSLSYGDIWNLPPSISEPHTTEFDEGLEEGFDYLRKIGIIK